MHKLKGGLRHTFWSLLDTISYPVVYLAATPLLIRYMGTAAFGFWMVLNTLIVVLQLASFNLGFTAMRHLAHERAAGSLKATEDIINSLLRITISQFAGVTLIGGGLVALLTATGWLGRYTGGFPHGALCFSPAVVLGGLKYFEQLFQSVIKSYERFRSAAVLNMAFRIGSLVITLGTAMLFHGAILYVLIANIVYSLCYLGVHFLYIRRVIPSYKPGLARNPELQAQLLRFSIWPWLQTLIVVLTFQADRFWVSAYSGFDAVSSYALTATIFNHIHLIFMASVAWISPRIISMYAAGEDPGPLYDLARSMLAIGSLATLLLFWLIAPLIFPLWIGEATYLRLREYLQGFTGFELAYVNTIMPLFFLNGTGRERQATTLTLVSSGVCYVLMLGGLWIFSSPVALVRGMAAGACLTVPLFNLAANTRASAQRGYAMTLMESVPVLAAVGVVYTSLPWLRLLLVATVGWSAWKCYAIPVNKENLWRLVSSYARKGK